MKKFIIEGPEAILETLQRYVDMIEEVYELDGTVTVKIKNPHPDPSKTSTFTWDDAE